MRRNIGVRRSTGGPLSLPTNETSVKHELSGSEYLSNSKTLAERLNSLNFTAIPTFPPDPKEESYEELIAKGWYRHATNRLRGMILSSTDPQHILHLCGLRLNLLYLLGYTSLAAHEAEILTSVMSSDANYATELPWSLRLISVRVQTSAYKDFFRAIVTYHSMVLEARAKIIEGDDGYRDKLEPLGLLIAGALMEMNDFESALLHLETMDTPMAKYTTGLLCIQIGSLRKAKEILDDKGLIAVADGRYEEAQKWFKESSMNDEQSADGRNNVAICEFFQAHTDESAAKLESLVQDYPMDRFVHNLTTLYELHAQQGNHEKKTLLESINERVYSLEPYKM